MRSDRAIASVTPGTSGKPGLCPNRCRAPVLELLLLVFVVCCFAALFCCFTGAVPFLSCPGQHLIPVYNSECDGTLSELQMWVGSTFCLQGPHGKGGEGWSYDTIFLLLLNMTRIDFLYILLSGFLFSLQSLSSPPSQCKSESPLSVFI